MCILWIRKNSKQLREIVNEFVMKKLPFFVRNFDEYRGIFSERKISILTKCYFKINSKTSNFKGLVIRIFFSTKYLDLGARISEIKKLTF